MNQRYPRASHALLAALWIGLASLSGCRNGVGGNDAELLASARGYLEKREFPAAVIQLKSALQKSPDSREVRLLLGGALLESGDPAAAAIELRKALELGASDAEVKPSLARAMLAQGQWRQVADQFATLQLESPAAYADLQTSVATALAALGQKDRAAAFAQSALQSKPDFVPALMLQARMKAAETDITGALGLIDQILTLDSTHLGALLLRGNVQRYAQRDAKAAMATFELALQAHPKDVAAHLSVINLTLESGDVADARKRLELLKAAHPKHPETVFLEARFAFADKDFERTRTLTDQLLQALPDDPRVLQLAGINALRLKSLNVAEAHLLKVVKAQPQNPVARQLLAGVYNRTGEHGKALSVLKPLIDAPNADSASLTLAGEAYLQAGDSAAAESAFTRAARGNPKATTARSALALAQLARGNTSEGFAELEAAAATDTGIRSSLALIAARVRANELPAALKAIDALEKKQPDRPIASSLRGSTLLKMGKPDEATASFEKALKIDPRYFPATAGLAGIELAAGRPEAAKKRFDDLLSLDPRNTSALLALAELKARMGGKKDEVTAAIKAAIQANPAEARPRLLLVNYLLQQRDSAGALLAAQEAGSALPNNFDVLDAIGTAQLAAGQAQQAVATFGKLAGLRPDRPEPELRQAEAHLANNDPDAAKRSLRKALEIRPGLLPAQRALAQIAVKQNDVDEALRIARSVQKAQPKLVVGYVLEADIELARNRAESALPLLRKAMDLKGTSEIAVRLHTALELAKRGADADRHAAAWLKAHPTDAAFRFYLGDKALARQDYAQAEVQYQKVLEIQPKNALAMNNVAWIMGQAKRPGALALAQKANEILPDQPALMDTLAYLLALENQWQPAIDLQKRAMAAAPQNEGLRLTLAKIYVQAGQKAQARTELETLAKLGDKFAGQAEVKQLLAAL